MPRPDRHSQRLPPIRVYRDDLEHLARLVSSSGGKVEFRHSGVVYESVEELAAHVKTTPLDALVIQPVGAADGAAAISILPREVEVFSLSPSQDQALKAVEYLKRHARGAQPAWWRVVYAALGWLVSILVGAVILRAYDGSAQVGWLLGGFTTVVVLTLLQGLRQPLGESAIFLHPRGGPGLVGQPRRVALIAGISGMIGLLLGLLMR